IQQLEKIVGSQYELGLARKIDLDRVRVNRSNLVAQREQLLNAISQQQNLLKYYMGMPITEQIDIPETSLEQLENTVQNRLLEASFSVNSLTPYLVLKKQEEL